MEAKKAQIDTDVVGLNRVLQNTGGDTKPPSLDDLTKMMSGCSKAAMDFAKSAELSNESRLLLALHIPYVHHNRYMEV